MSIDSSSDSAKAAEVVTPGLKETSGSGSGSGPSERPGSGSRLFWFGGGIVTLANIIDAIQNLQLVGVAIAVMSTAATILVWVTLGFRRGRAWLQKHHIDRKRGSELVAVTIAAWVLLIILRLSRGEQPAGCDVLVEGKQRLSASKRLVYEGVVCLRDAMFDLGGFDLTIKARSVRVLSRSTVASDAAGPSIPGRTGDDAPGQSPVGGCREQAEARDAEGWPTWCKAYPRSLSLFGNETPEDLAFKNWKTAGEECERSDSCSRGRDGQMGDSGWVGPTLDFELEESPSLRLLVVDLRGTPGAAGGAGGRGMRLYLYDGDACPDPKTLRPVYETRSKMKQCPSGRPGEPGKRGAPGACKVEIAGRTRLCSDFL